MSVTRQENEGRHTNAIDELLEELAELRELDRRRQAHAPGSVGHDAATLEVDLRSRRLMDRFRDLKEHRDLGLEARAVEGTKPLDAHRSVERQGRAHLN
jgi:hypothetical protein